MVGFDLVGLVPANHGPKLNDYQIRGFWTGYLEDTGWPAPRIWIGPKLLRSELQRPNPRLGWAYHSCEFIRNSFLKLVNYTSRLTTKNPFATGCQRLGYHLRPARVGSTYDHAKPLQLGREGIRHQLILQSCFSHRSLPLIIVAEHLASASVT